MSIVFVIFTLQGNGAERVILTLTQKMRSMGHDAHIVVFKDHIDFEIDSDIPVHLFPYHKFRILPKSVRSYFAAKAFDKFVAEQIGKPDLVFSNLAPVDAILTKSNLKNIHFVIHNTMSREYSGRPVELARFLNVYRKKSCVCVSKGVEEDLSLLLGKDVKSRTIYNPVDPNSIMSSANIDAPEIDNFGDYVINVGGFKKAKRHDILLEAFAKSGTNNKLLLLGKGGLFEETKNFALELGISDRVIFAGFRDNPFPFIKAAKALVVSSDFEGLGMTILEALCLNVPVISTDCPSGPSEILPMSNLVPVGDVNALADKINDVLENPSAFSVDLKDVFLSENSVREYLSLYVK
jgi:glycosyltransferase involved in cell wall biosynthesis